MVIRRLALGATLLLLLWVLFAWPTRAAYVAGGIVVDSSILSDF